MQAIATTANAEFRLRQIAAARTAVLQEGRSMTDALVDGWWEGAWIERSWRRCLEAGRRPQQAVAFDVVAKEAPARLQEAHQGLIRAARPVLERLGRALERTRYFAILTNEHGVVIDAHGPIDTRDRRAALITRVGVDLSEAAVGTTAIGAALAERQAVWLHRGEHFFDDTSCYSCAGAPLFGPTGDCIGMLDLTGIEATERPELKHLVSQSARSIENALTAAQPHRLLLRLNWPGRSMGGDEDGILALDGDGWVRGANGAAREMLPVLRLARGSAHCSELFAQPWEPLYDGARVAAPEPCEMSLWSGLRLQVLPVAPGAPAAAPVATPLRDLETVLIRKAVADAGGNVAKAAQVLGISRATVYRKLARKAAPGRLE